MELWHSWPFTATLGVPEKAWIGQRSPGWSVPPSEQREACIFFFLGGGHNTACGSSRTPPTYQWQ